MADHEFAEGTSLKSVLGSFISAYVERDRNMGFPDWLTDRICLEMPDMSKKEGQNLTDEIIEDVAGYDRTLAELNAAVDAGQSKEAWFAECLSDAYAGMPTDAAGERLEQIEYGLAASNMQLMQGIDETQTDMEVGEADIIDIDAVEWNKFSLKNKAYEIGEQVILSGMAVAANVVKDRVQGSETGETADIGDIVKETLQDGLKTNPGEVKAVVAGAVKVAVEKGVEDAPPKDTPMETIGAMAGEAVESAKALDDMANGKSTMLDTAEKVVRAGIAAVCRCAGDMVKKGVSEIPVVGPRIADLSGGLVDHLVAKFTDHICEGFHSLVVTAKTKFTEKIKKIGNALFG